HGCRSGRGSNGDTATYCIIRRGGRADRPTPASPAGSWPRGESTLMTIRQILLGSPIPTSRAKHERLPKFLALPVFASDALSSVAYATQEILSTLLAAGIGLAAFQHVIPISFAIIALLVIVTISYRQTIHAYPGGGGAYIVARDNLGVVAAQTAGAALLIDYILTVSVSVAAGID